MDFMKLNIVETDNKFKINRNLLFSMAWRKNRKRAFLFVSKLIGKHVAVEPNIPLITSSILAYLYANSIEGKDYKIENLIKAIENEENIPEAIKYIQNNKIKVSKPTLFIGFAETATALGFGVFKNFTGESFYIHSTREDIKEIEETVNFEEEHSHATSHKFYAFDASLFERAERVVLIDDELTTGKTALNLINAIKNKFNINKEFFVLSILDWREKKELEENGIKAFYMLGGKVGLEHLIEPTINYVNVHCDSIKKQIKSKDVRLKGSHLIKLSGKIYTRFTGRFGIDSLYADRMDEECERIADLLKKSRKHTKTLVVGFGEYMYVPCLISKYMGEGIKFESLTRSPINVINEDGYPIRDAIEFKTENDVIMHIYNILDGLYDEVFFISENDIDCNIKKHINTELSKRGIREVHYVYFEEMKEPEKLGSYSQTDVTFLLKDLSGKLDEQDNETREKIIQNGGHYSEMLPIEYRPKDEYMEVFYKILETEKGKIAKAVGIVSELILRENGENLVLASLARAGTPIGVLIKMWLRFKHNIEVPHYSISIIRGKGIDENAVFYMLQNHPCSHIKFIDGWTGKGMITNVLNEALDKFYSDYGIMLDKELAVLSDPGFCVPIYGTREDFLIPSACLNSTVSGLMSRTVLKDELIGKEDFHGVKYYKEWKDIDVSNFFIEQIVGEFPFVEIAEEELNIDKDVTFEGMKSVERISKAFDITNINLIKPGVGETTRVLLRRVPWKILVRDLEDENLKHILLLAKDRNVPIEIYKDMSYSCCGLIKAKGES